MKHVIMMLIGCVLPFLLIFILPALWGEQRRDAGHFHRSHAWLPPIHGARQPRKGTQ